MKRNDNICKECLYIQCDNRHNVSCLPPTADYPMELVSEYLPACFRFKSK